MTNVLVTGGSGYIGSWCILALLSAGHSVRTTVRDLARELGAAYEREVVHRDDLVLLSRM